MNRFQRVSNTLFLLQTSLAIDDCLLLIVIFLEEKLFNCKTETVILQQKKTMRSIDNRLSAVLIAKLVEIICLLNSNEPQLKQSVRCDIIVSLYNNMKCTHNVLVVLVSSFHLIYFFFILKYFGEKYIWTDENQRD